MWNPHNPEENPDIVPVGAWRWIVPWVYPIGLVAGGIALGLIAFLR